MVGNCTSDELRSLVAVTVTFLKISLGDSYSYSEKRCNELLLQLLSQSNLGTFKLQSHFILRYTMMTVRNG